MDTSIEDIVARLRANLQSKAPPAQTLQEWHAAGGGIPTQYKDKPDEWHAKVKHLTSSGEVKMGIGGLLNVGKGVAKASKAMTAAKAPLNAALEAKLAAEMMSKPTQAEAIAKSAPKKPTPKAPQDDALEKARANGVRILGLHENNTPLERAAAMGFDVNTNRFHGSDKDIQAFDPAKFGQKDSGFYGRGVTTSTDPEISSAYADYNEPSHGQVVYPLLTRGKYMQWPEGQLPFGSRKDAIQGTKDIQKLGRSGTEMTFDSDLYGGNPQISTEQVTFDPAYVRSRFAAFDPELIDMSGLSYRHGGEVHMAGAGAVSKIKKAGQLLHEAQAPMRAAKDAELAAQLMAMPARSRQANIDMGLYHPVGGNLKLSTPFSGMHSTHVLDPAFKNPKINIITPEQLAKENAAFFPLIGDRARTGTYLTHVGDQEINPIRMTGGSRYMDANYDPINPENSSAWESHPAVISQLGNQAKLGAKGDRPVFGMYVAGSGTNTDFNKMGANALMQQIPFSEISKKSAKAFDDAMRAENKAMKHGAFPNWPGILHPEAKEMLLGDTAGGLRTKLFETMELGPFQSSGFPNVAATRKSIMEPDLYDVPTHQAGYRIARMDPTGRIIENPIARSDYPVSAAGNLEGKLDIPEDYKDVFSSHFGARRLLSQPEKGDYYSFLRAKPLQYADDEWLNKLMEKRNARDALIKQGGYKEGGEVHMKGGGGGDITQADNADYSDNAQNTEIIKNLGDMLRNQYLKEKASLKNKGALQDTLLKVGSLFGGGLYDIAHMGAEGLDYLQSKIPDMNKPASVMDAMTPIPRQRSTDTTARFPIASEGITYGGSEMFNEKLRNAGLITDTERPLLENTLSLVSPMAGPLARLTGKSVKAGIKNLQVPTDPLFTGPLGKQRGVIKPQGNLNLTPMVRAEILKGPEAQTSESFLNQLRGKSGMTQEGFDDLVKQYQGLEPNTRMTKAEFEKRIPASKYNKVDLAEAAANNEEHLLDEATEMANQNRYRVYEGVLDRLGVSNRPDNLTMLDQYHSYYPTMNAGEFRENSELYQAIKQAGMDSTEGRQLLDDLFQEKHNNLINFFYDDLRRGQEQGTRYAYQQNQRLMQNTHENPERYFELGVSHPEQRESYRHYQEYEGDEGLIGHVRGTFIPADATDKARQLINPSRSKRLSGESDEVLMAEPNSMVIEEIQSDAQKGKVQSGALRQAHGTMFKAAIQHALENGATTVYLPTANSIAYARSAKASQYAPIYDQQVVKEGLNPLLKIPGVSSEKIGDSWIKLDFTPEANDFILKGEGQVAPGYAKGGEVHMKEGGFREQDTVSALKPKYPTLEAIARGLQGGDDQMSKPVTYQFGKRSTEAIPPTAFLSELLSIPALARTAERLAYGEPLTSGSGQTLRPLDDTTDAFLTVAPSVGPLARVTGKVTKAAAKSLAPKAGAMLDEFTAKYNPKLISSNLKKELPVQENVSRLATEGVESQPFIQAQTTGPEYVTKQEGPFYRVSPTSLDLSGAKSRGLREADELQSQASVGSGAGQVGSEVPLRISDEEVARLISNPETNQPLQIAKRFTKDTQGTDFTAPNIPESSLAKQSAIGRAHQLAVDGSPEYKTSVFDAYAQQMPDVLEQAGAKNYDDLMEKAYRQLAKETDEQFKQLPYNFSYHRKGEGDYLGGSKEMMADVHGNKHLYVFQGGNPHDFLNRLDKASGLNENEKFRAVHDLLGHAVYGNQFGPRGEELAYAVHQQMYSPLARLAMASETRGQNSLVNYSPLNVKLKSNIAKLEDLEVEARRRGDNALVNEIKAAKRQEFSNNFQFAPQKAVLLPPEFIDPKFAGGLPDYLSAANQPMKGTQSQSVLTHFSNNPNLQMVDPTRYGAGIKGLEAERLSKLAGGVKDRSYFYLGEPESVTAESGLGVNRYRGESQNLYDITKDPLSFRALARESNRTPFTAQVNAGITSPLQDANDYERLVKEYGYEGMINPNASKPMGIMFKSTPVQPRKRGGLARMQQYKGIR